jgi:hypothetical protein
MTEGDQKVGALGCTYAIYLEVQAATALCGWARGPTDDAIDEAIAAFDDFILANSSDHLSRFMLEGVKRGAASALRGRSTGQPHCESANYDILRQVRSANPDKIREWTKKLLSIPAKPGPYGCL